MVLFSQMYTTNVSELAETMERSEQQAKMNKGTQFNTQLIYSEDVSSFLMDSDPFEF